MSYGPAPRTQRSRSSPYDLHGDLPSFWNPDHFESSSSSTHSEGRVLCARTFLRNGRGVPNTDSVYPSDKPKFYQPISNVMTELLRRDDLDSVDPKDVFTCLYGILANYMDKVKNDYFTGQSLDGRWFVHFLVQTRHPYYLRLSSRISNHELLTSTLVLSRTEIPVDTITVLEPDTVRLFAELNWRLNDNGRSLPDASVWWDSISWRRAAASCDSQVLRDFIEVLRSVPSISLTIGVLSAEAAKEPVSQALLQFLTPNTHNLEWVGPLIHLAITYN
jgi:hypothetical protein